MNSNRDFEKAAEHVRRTLLRAAASSDQEDMQLVVPWSDPQRLWLLQCTATLPKSPKPPKPAKPPKPTKPAKPEKPKKPAKPKKALTAPLVAG